MLSEGSADSSSKGPDELYQFGSCRCMLECIACPRYATAGKNTGENRLFMPIANIRVFLLYSFSSNGQEDYVDRKDQEPGGIIDHLFLPLSFLVPLSSQGEWDPREWKGNMSSLDGIVTRNDVVSDDTVGFSAAEHSSFDPIPFRLNPN